ncbi:MAG: uroporphyrinogen-III C-methyltransferase [Pseudanabaenaceae cyanobacterium bins.68]|nr:uroporphyrinogen-III C-methyltransferase [Pseudanabaenaceae cyanobacterium bins.68]
MTIDQAALGRVYLVGAGIGGLDHLTRRAQQVIAQAEVIFYDALVAPEILALAPNAELVCVGKRAGQPSYAQAQINRLLVAAVSQGKSTVRLKSGDPLVFGRAVPELRALVDLDAKVELVPGISSAIAAALFAGIPLTDQVLSYGFGVISGHNLELLDWKALAQLPTLVCLMATANLADLINRLDRSPGTAIALVQNAGMPNQRLWTGTLGNILAQLPPEPIAPTVIIIGTVVDQAAWIRPCLTRFVECADQPLTGKRVLVTRAMGDSYLCLKLQELGAIAIELPTLEILPPDDWQLLDRAIANLSSYQWLVLTSANGVQSFFGRLAAAQLDARALAHLQIAVVGEKTAASLSSYGIRADLVPETFVADALADAFGDLTGQRVLFPRVQSGGREILVEQLTAKGAEVEAIAAYESSCPAAINPSALAAIQSQNLDLITFTSAKTVKHFAQLLNQVTDHTTWNTWIESAQIVAIGPQTAIACQQILGRVDAEAEIFSLDGMVQAILQLVATPFPQHFQN